MPASRTRGRSATGRGAAGTSGDAAYYVELGNTYLELGSREDAIDAFRRAIALAPRLPEAHYNLGNVLADLGMLAEAEQAYARAAKLRSGFVEAEYNRGEVLARMGRLEEAVVCYRRAVARAPDFLIARNNLGTVLTELGRFDEAAAALHDAVTRAPSTVALHINLGTALKHAGRIDEAVAALETAAALAPDSLDAQYNLGMALARAGDHRRAESAFRRVIDLQPDLARVYPSLGASLMAMGRHAEALALCDAFLERVPAERSVLAFKAILLHEMGETAAARHLADYDRLVVPYDPVLPDGYADTAAFNGALIRHILGHPSLMVSPTSHATVKGRHTGDLLLGEKGPFAAFERILWQAAEAYAATVPKDASHPFLASPPRLEKVVVWSVVMEHEGHQVPHIHPSGWLSGVYYAELPESVRKGDERPEGWIEFGMPPPEFPVSSAPPVKLFRPKLGRLFLFPSYFYHRTIPYGAQERRISIAFDFLPAAR